MVEVRDEPEVRRSVRRSALLERGPRVALAVFVMLEVLAVPMYLWFARDQWFHGDEWAFLADRQLGSFDDLMRPHVVHWCAIPIAVYRVLWTFFGINEYWPYQIVAIGGHLTVAALLRVVMRRAGVGPWIATAVAGAFILFGSGDQNIGWALQIAFTGPLALGLVQLILADHDGPIGRRDLGGLAAGLMGLMFSGVALTMIAVVGLAMLLRGRWRAALFHTVPLAAVFLAWWLAYGRDARILPDGAYVGVTLRFAWEGASGAFRALGILPGAGLAIAVVIVIGLALGVSTGGAREWRRAATPVALVLGSAVFLVHAGWGRAWILGAEYGNSSRYLHVTAALLLPGFALGTEYLYRRWAVAGIAALAVLMIGVPGNVSRAARYDEIHGPTLGIPQQVTAAGRQPLARVVPPDTVPFPNAARDLTIGWLVRATELGKVPEPDTPLTGVQQNVLLLRLGLDVENGGVPTEGCVELRAPTVRTMRLGTTVGVSEGRVRVGPAGSGSPEDTIVTLTSGDRVSVTVEPVELQFQPAKTGESAVLCG